jgi:hypothetical protein
MKTLNDTTTELVSLIEKNRDKIGAFDGPIENFYAKFASTPDFQRIKTLMQATQAAQRKFFAGSAVTPTEMEALKDFIGGTQDMNPDNLITQLNTVRELSQDEYNNQRRNYTGNVEI